MIAERLSSLNHVVVPDLYGFGSTPHPEKPLTLEDYAEGVRNLLSRLSVKECVVVGHSFGGRVAMRLAVRDLRVSGVILIDSAGIPPRRGIDYRARVAAYKIGRRFHLKHLPKGSSDYAALTGVMRRTFVNVVNESNEKDARSIAVPTLLLWGKEDKDTPMYMCKKLCKLIRGSECVLMNGGHFAYLEHVDFVCRVIRAFRERI